MLALVFGVAFCLLFATSPQTQAQQKKDDLSAEAVQRAINRGVSFLKSQQLPSGRWNYSGNSANTPGATALCTLALLNSGLPATDPAVSKALSYLRTVKLDQHSKVYNVALKIMVFSTATPEKDRLLITQHVRWLEKAQATEGNGKGSWSYGAFTRKNGDNSNSQFAILALNEAERANVAVSNTTWKRAHEYWDRVRLRNSTWRYDDNNAFSSTGSMTSAGVCSTIICSRYLTRPEDLLVDGQVVCCQNSETNEALEEALNWLGKTFNTTRNPPSSNNLHSQWLLYYLYGIERVGRLTGRRFLGNSGRDWYREGAKFFVQQQDRLGGYWIGEGAGEQDKNIGTSFALLFLSKGKRPVVITQLKYADDSRWNLHPQGVGFLTRHTETLWKKSLTWQTIDFSRASTIDLLQTPVLFMSGKKEFSLSPKQKQQLKDYVNGGGFLFVEACHGDGCDATAFKNSFRRLMAELFPESPMRVLPPDHPVWYAEEAITQQGDLPTLYGIDACCRTSIVYCEENLSCYWSLHYPRSLESFPSQVKEKVEMKTLLGANVLAYATNRELSDKLDLPTLAALEKLDPELSRGVLQLAKLQHNGGSNDAPNALLNLLQAFNQELEVRVSPKTPLVVANHPSLPQYPILFMHGRRTFRLTPAERKSLKTYLERGGFLFIDSICSSESFNRSVRQEIKLIFEGKQTLTRLPETHPLFAEDLSGKKLGQVTLRKPLTGNREAGSKLSYLESQIHPELEGITLDDRLAVVFSPYDLSCGLENGTSPTCTGYKKEDALQIGLHILLYALEQ
ncbi:MAG: DUF4159 domain-containing protein [Pirellulaceae bacterium]|nr:DUF4159 domain-containing protein [Pirellulaceae bacterium]